MAFVDNNQIEEVRGKEKGGTHGLIDTSLFLFLLIPVAIELVIEAKVDLIGGIADTIVEVFVEVNLVADVGERGEVVGLCLVDEDIAVGKKEDAMAEATLEKTPDDLEGNKGLSCAGGKDQKDTPLPFGDGLERVRDGAPLITTRRLGFRRTDIVRLAEEASLGGREGVAAVSMGKEALVERLGGRKCLHGKFAFLAGEQIVFLERLAVGGIGERGSAKLGVADGLLEAEGRQGVRTLGLDDGDGIGVRMVPKEIIRALFGAAPGFIPGKQNPPIGKTDLGAHPLLEPSCTLKRRRNETDFDILLGERNLAQYQPGTLVTHTTI